MTSLYIIENREQDRKIYKFGSHTGDIQKLYSRYITPIPNMNLLFFETCPNARFIEEQIKQKLKEYRMNNVRAHKSEWYDMDYYVLVRCVHKIVDEYMFGKNADQIRKDFEAIDLHTKKEAKYTCKKCDQGFDIKELYIYHLSICSKDLNKYKLKEHAVTEDLTINTELNSNKKKEK